ncbi:hypothetical protein [Paenibacillus pabuli]|uniref:hypothetical protein n=1 Tax=Paenibacillus pabuli TaxID=1472 RepID=UPI003CFAEFD3
MSAEKDTGAYCILLYVFLRIFALGIPSFDSENELLAQVTLYRYIRIYNSGSWFGNIAELRLHGLIQDVEAY